MHSMVQWQWDVWEQGQGHHCGSSGCTASLRMGGTCGDWAGSQYCAEGVLWGTRCPARTACGQRGITATARVYRLPATSAWQMVAFGGKVRAEQGQVGSWLAHGNLLNQLEVLPAGGWHTAHTCWGSSAAGLRCYGAHTAPAVSLLFPILAQLCDSLGRAPQSLADCLDHVPLGREYPGQMPEVVLRLALPNITTRHPSAQCHRAVPHGSCAPARRAAAEPTHPTWLKVPGVSQPVCPGFCTQAQGASHSEAVGKLWTA